jgi:tetratricopeptide (TPR) repeat protein
VGTAFVSAPAVEEADLDASIAVLQEQLTGGSDEDWVGYATLGAAYLQKARLTGDPGFYPLAERTFRKSIAIEADNPIAILGMGELANARHDFAVARAWAGRALEQNRVSSVAHGILGDAEIELGNYQSAFKTYQRMVDLRPGLPSYARVSYARELTGDEDGAKDAMRAALRSAGNDSSARAWAGNELGNLCLRSGESDRAKALYLEALAIAPAFTPARVGLARTDIVIGRLDRAAARLERVVRVLPSPVYVALLGDVYSALGREREAATQYDLVLAQEKLARSNGVRPDVEIPLFLADHGIRLDRALEIVRSQYRTRKSIYVADAYAWTLHALGRDREAARFARAALRLGTRDAMLHYHAGEIARSLGREADARRHLSLALQIDPHFSVRHADDARTALRTLGGRS